ncbi:hypothetical protein SGRIM128S_04879 [Streptomyces griseomycini]
MAGLADRLRPPGHGSDGPPHGRHLGPRAGRRRPSGPRPHRRGPAGGGRDRAGLPGEHAGLARCRPRRPDVRDVHIRLDRAAQGGRRHPPGCPGPGRGPAVRRRSAPACAVPLGARLRRVDVRGLGAPARRRNGGGGRTGRVEPRGSRAGHRRAGRHRAVPHDRSLPGPRRGGAGVLRRTPGGVDRRRTGALRGPRTGAAGLPGDHRDRRLRPDGGDGLRHVRPRRRHGPHRGVAADRRAHGRDQDVRARRGPRPRPAGRGRRAVRGGHRSGAGVRSPPGPDRRALRGGPVRGGVRSAR